MERKPILIFIFIVISALIVVLPAYFRCFNLRRAKLVTTDLSFETLDEENLLIDRHKQSRIFVSSASLIMLYLGTNVFEPISCFSFGSFSLNQISMILRC
jgi:hypothetical protein